MFRQALALMALTLSLTANSAIINLSADLSCANANAGNGTCGAGGSGTGTMTGTLDDATNLFSWAVTWSGLSGIASAAHFHGAATENQNAGVQVGIGVGSNPAIGSATISGQQANDLLAGLWYVNVHSAAFAGGEIRGQVYASPVPVPAAAWLFGSAIVGLAGLTRKR